jgi:hypothetical protein
MKHALRFLFGAAIGVGLGYALTLLVRPAAPRRKGHDRPAREQDGAP